MHKRGRTDPRQEELELQAASSSSPRRKVYLLRSEPQPPVGHEARTCLHMVAAITRGRVFRRVAAITVHHASAIAATLRRAATTRGPALCLASLRDTDRRAPEPRVGANTATGDARKAVGCPDDLVYTGAGALAGRRRELRRPARRATGVADVRGAGGLRRRGVLCGAPRGARRRGPARGTARHPP